MENIKYWVWLSKIPGLGPINQFKLLKQYILPENIWNLDKTQIMKCGITEKLSNEILKKEHKENLDKYLEYMCNNNIELLHIYDKEYPSKLKNIYDPPLILYLKGNKKILNDTNIAVIGCRLCSEYGKKVARKFGQDLSQNNINVVSGLAKGIDTYAHIGALEKTGKTIAVVGCGLDTVYPPENKKIFNEIVNSQGVILSEYIIGQKPVPNNFPARNRIISGISDGIVVVEAKEKSGTLITVDFALEQGKQVYAIPGNINSINSNGTNELIKQGAKIITKVEEILEDFVKKH